MSDTGTQILDDLLATIESKLRMNGAAGGLGPESQSRGLPASEDTGRPTACGTTDGDTGRVDAITTVLNEEPRTTAVVSLREDPAVEAFRQALTDGLIRVDTANRLLRLINEIIVRMVP
jgi:hypothetical protein